MIPGISKKFIIIKRRRAGLLNRLSPKWRECWFHPSGSAPPGSLPRWGPCAAGSIRAWVNRVPGRPRLGAALALGLARGGGARQPQEVIANPHEDPGPAGRRGASAWGQGGTARGAEDSAERPRPLPQRSRPRSAPHPSCAGDSAAASPGAREGSWRARPELAGARRGSPVPPCSAPAAPPVPDRGAGTRVRGRLGLGRLPGFASEPGPRDAGLPLLFPSLSLALCPGSRALSRRRCYPGF